MNTQLSSSPVNSLTPDSMSHDLSLVNSTSSSERSDKPDGLEVRNIMI